MDFMVGGRACGKTTFLVQQVCTAIRKQNPTPHERVMVVVANGLRADLWKRLLKERLNERELDRVVLVAPHQIDNLRGFKGPRFVDDADEVLASILGGYDLAIANGDLFSW